MPRGVKKQVLSQDLINAVLTGVRRGYTKKKIAVDNNTSYFLINRIIRENPQPETSEPETSEPETSD